MAQKIPLLQLLAPRSLGAVALVLTMIPAAAAAPADSGYHPNTAVEDGTEFGFVYIGSSGCSFCRLPEMKQAVIRAKDILAERARAKGQQFYATGVSTDLSIQRGLDFLQDVGPFDQIVVGRGVHNLGVLVHVATDAGASPGEPQIVLIEQEIRQTPTRVWAGRARLVRRLMGTEILGWVKKGAPLEE